MLGQNLTGGTELQSRWLVTALRSRGIEVDVFLIDGSAGLTGLDRGGRALSLGSDRSRGVRKVIEIGRTAYVLRRHIRRGRYQVVHGAMARGYVLAALASIGLKSTVVVAWRRNLGIHHQGSSPTERRIERIAARFTDKFIANSAEVRDYWVKHGHGSYEQYRVIPNALEDWRFDRVPPATGHSPVPRLVSVGGLKPGKHHIDLIEAAGILKSQGKEVEVILIGDGEARSQIEKRSRDLGVKLSITGMVSDPRPWLEGADIYVHPSVSEGMSNAIAEAMAYGMPIVATNVGGTAEMLCGTGLLAPPVKPARLAIVIKSLLDDKQERERLGSSARARAAKEFRASRVLDLYIGTYGLAEPCVES